MTTRIRKLKKKCGQFSHWLYDLFIGRPVYACKLICFWVGFTVCSSFTLGLISAGIFYFSIPSLEKTSFDDIKKMASQSVLKKISKKEHKKKYKWTKIDDINRDLIFSMIYSEDSQYFKHDGFNLDATLRSLANNYKKMAMTQGGSTITQQVAKNLFLSHSKTISRKIKEFILSKRLEEKFTKNQILELYLNMIELGPDIYGVGHASTYYFHKTPKKIHAAEGAFLALLLPSPRKYHYALFQNQNLTKAKKRKIRRILGNMHSEGLISQKQLNRFLNYNYFSHSRPNRRPASRR